MADMRNTSEAALIGVWDRADNFLGLKRRRGAGYESVTTQKTAFRHLERGRLNLPPLIRAQARANGEAVAPTVAAPVVRRLSNGQLVQYTVGGALAGAEPAFASTAQVNDGAAKYWPLGSLSRAAATDVVVPAVTNILSGDFQALPTTQQFYFYADRDKFLHVSTPNVDLADVDKSIAWAHNNGGTNEDLGGGTGVGKMAYRRVEEFETDAPLIDIVFKPTGVFNDRPRIWINDYLLEEVPSAWVGAAGATQAKRVDFSAVGATGWNRFAVEVHPGTLLKSVLIPGKYKLRKPQKKGLVCRQIGDSWNATTTPDLVNWAHSELLSEQLARGLGIRYVINQHEGGTGYVQDGTNGRKNALWQLVNNDFSAVDVDYVFMSGLIGNDVGAGFSVVQIVDAFKAAFVEARRQHPSAFIVVEPGWSYQQAIAVSMLGTIEAMKSEFIALADAKSAFVSPTTGEMVDPVAGYQQGDPWFSGTGNIGAPGAGVNAGNADWYLGPDAGSHPSPIGKIYLRARRVEAIGGILDRCGY